MNAHCESVVHFETRLIAELLETVKEIPGEKILTLLNHSGTYKYEVSQSGGLSCDANHGSNFCCNVVEALRKGGALFIREIPKITALWAPTTNLYAIAFGYGKWAGLSAIEVQDGLKRDAELLQLVRDPGIRYKSLEGYLSS